MYEGIFQGNLGRLKRYACLSLLFDFLCFCLGDSIGDVVLFLLLWLVYPIIDSDGPFGILLYLISQTQAWHLPFSEDVMQSRGADPELLGYSTLLFIITYHPQCEFVQDLAPLFLCLLFWTNIRSSDTLVSISRSCVQINS